MHIWSAHIGTHKEAAAFVGNPASAAASVALECML